MYLAGVRSRDMARLPESSFSDCTDEANAFCLRALFGLSLNRGIQAWTDEKDQTVDDCATLKDPTN